MKPEARVEQVDQLISKKKPSVVVLLLSKL